MNSTGTPLSFGVQGTNGEEGSGCSFDQNNPYTTIHLSDNTNNIALTQGKQDVGGDNNYDVGFQAPHFDTNTITTNINNDNFRKTSDQIWSISDIDFADKAFFQYKWQQRNC